MTEKIALWGKDLFGAPIAPFDASPLAKRFIVPPTSILDSRKGEWRSRKHAWQQFGIRGEEGRGEDDYGLLVKGPTLQRGEKWDTGMPAWYGPATSVFDPVLCEIVYTWFCTSKGSILDPFAGESTKGIVAACLGYDYWGIELRPEQVAANRKQAEATGVSPQWVTGDSSNVLSLAGSKRFDMIWTSPPYYDLEVYSNDKRDGSTAQTYEQFMEWYCNIFRDCVWLLKPNRFLAVKVGEIRDEKGAYRNFVGDNMSLFQNLGLHYYNELIFITPYGSLPIRVGRQFAASRKIGKTHQNILVFFKGDPATIKEEYEAIDLPEQSLASENDL